MTIHGSKAFVEKFGCPVSWPGEKPAQGQAIDAWSGDILKVSRASQVAVMMHDASLATTIVSLKGVRRFEEFLLTFLRCVAELWEASAASFDAANQNVLILRRNNRSLIGSLNNAKQLIRFTMADQMAAGEPIDWNEAQQFINQTPFAVIDYESPLERLKLLLRPVD